MANTPSSKNVGVWGKMQDFFSFMGLYTELRFFFERRRFRQQVEKLLAELPRGDGHPVIIVPGLGADDASTEALREALQKLGYVVYGWGLGMNRGPASKLDVKLDKLLLKVYRRHGCKVSIIGWSMGGLFAREMARNRPNHTRRVITLVSPFAVEVEKHLSRFILKIFRDYTGYTVERMQMRLSRTRPTPPVLCTSIYSKGDAIVRWEGCLEEPVPHAENLCVRGSHWGMVHNIEALKIVAHRLALPDNQLN